MLQKKEEKKFKWYLKFYIVFSNIKKNIDINYHFIKLNGNSLKRCKCDYLKRPYSIKQMPHQLSSSCNPLSCLTTKPFGVFRGFLRNLRKYGLWSLRKTPHSEHTPCRSRSYRWTIGLNSTTQHNNIKQIFWIFSFD